MVNKNSKHFLSSATSISDPPGVFEFERELDAEVAATSDEQFFVEINELRVKYGISPFNSIEECIKSCM